MNRKQKKIRLISVPVERCCLADHDRRQLLVGATARLLPCDADHTSPLSVLLGPDPLPKFFIQRSEFHLEPSDGLRQVQVPISLPPRTNDSSYPMTDSSPPPNDTPNTEIPTSVPRTSATYTRFRQLARITTGPTIVNTLSRILEYYKELFLPS